MVIGWKLANLLFNSSKNPSPPLTHLLSLWIRSDPHMRRFSELSKRFMVVNFNSSMTPYCDSFHVFRAEDCAHTSPSSGSSIVYDKSRESNLPFTSWTHGSYLDVRIGMLLLNGSSNLMGLHSPELAGIQNLQVRILN